MKKNVLSDLSIVIPSLGGKCLYQTVTSIMKSSLLPSEIVIGLPNGTFLNFLNLIKLNNKIKLKIVYSKKGQVHQRTNAIRHTKKTFILQIDDDLQLQNNCIQELYLTVKNSYKTNVGPLINEVIRRKRTFKHYCGKIKKNGHAVPLGTCCAKKRLTYVEWLPGGCVMSRRKDIIIKNFFPFTGKAYFEDLFNSMERKKSNIRQYINKNARIYLSKSHNNTLPKNELFKYLVIKKIFVKKYFGTGILFYFSCFKILLANILKNLFNIKS